MKNNQTHAMHRRSLLVASMVVAALVGITYLATAKAVNSINITINNQSQRDIRHLYLAAGDPNNWGPDQLNGSTIPSGASYTLEGVACNGSSIRVIAEDQNGCFLYNNVSCGGNATWVITNDATPDCGN
jgi:hypothetical protein